MGEVVIPMIAFIEGGMTLPIGSVTRDYLFNHRLCPHQCAPNLFRVLGSVDALNEHLGLLARRGTYVRVLFPKIRWILVKVPLGRSKDDIVFAQVK